MFASMGPLGKKQHHPRIELKLLNLKTAYRARIRRPIQIFFLLCFARISDQEVLQLLSPIGLLPSGCCSLHPCQLESVNASKPFRSQRKGDHFPSYDTALSSFHQKSCAQGKYHNDFMLLGSHTELVTRKIIILATLWTVARQAPLSWILQARILEGVTIPFPRRSSPLRDQTQVSCIADRFFSI